jgi:transcriptional regulator with XRE-family HTH domain
MHEVRLDDTEEYIRNQLRKAREEARLSQYQLADRYGSTQSSISGIERGRVEIGAAALARFAQILHKPITYFYPGNHDTLDEQEEQLLYLFRGMPEDLRHAALASIRAQFELYEQTKRIERMPSEQREDAAMEAFAAYLLNQGVRATVDETGTPRLEGADINAYLQGIDEIAQKAVMETVRKLQEKQRKGTKEKNT